VTVRRFIAAANNTTEETALVLAEPHIELGSTAYTDDFAFYKVLDTL